MLGKWKGSYRYHDKDVQKLMGFPETNFEMEIVEFDGKNFNGSIRDDLATGGMDGYGRVSGTVNGDKISFIRAMPIMTVKIYSGRIIKFARRHPELLYSGVKTGDSCFGTWKFKSRWVWLYIIPFPFRKLSGSWSISKLEESL